MISKRGMTPVVLLVALAAGAWGCMSDPAVPLAEGKATVSLSEPARFYPVGDEVSLNVSVFNRSEQALLADADLWGGARFVLEDTGGQVHPPQLVDVDEGDLIAPGQRASRSVDMAGIFPALGRPGDYRLTVVFPGFRSNTVGIKVIPAYEPGVNYEAQVVTDYGTFTLKFFPDVAPGHVRNFINLARSGYYDNNIVHRVIPGVMFQTGDPTSSGRGGPGWTIKAEFNDKPHVRGTLSMARQSGNPDSAGGQWFICLDRSSHWDGQYTVFGHVLSGMDTVERIGDIQVEEEIPQEVVIIQQVVISAQAGAGSDGPGGRPSP